MGAEIIGEEGGQTASLDSINHIHAASIELPSHKHCSFTEFQVCSELVIHLELFHVISKKAILHRPTQRSYGL